MFVQSEDADLWRASWRLLLAFHASRFEADASFGPETEGWPSIVERVRAGGA